MRDGSMAEVKAMSAYAGKENGRRFEPVRLGCVGEAPGDFWEQAVAQVGVRAASPHPRVGAVSATPEAAGAKAREAPCPAGERARKIRGEGLGVPAHRLPRGFRADVRYEVAGAPLGW